VIPVIESTPESPVVGRLEFKHLAPNRGLAQVVSLIVAHSPWPKKEIGRHVKKLAVASKRELSILPIPVEGLPSDIKALVSHLQKMNIKSTFKEGPSVNIGQAVNAGGSVPDELIIVSVRAGSDSISAAKEINKYSSNTFTTPIIFKSLKLAEHANSRERIALSDAVSQRAITALMASLKKQGIDSARAPK
jgi:hypothetical protein